MQRSGFNVLFLIIAFQILFLFTLKTQNQSKIVSNPETKFANDYEKTADEIKFVCRDAELKRIWWNLLKEDSFIVGNFLKDHQDAYDCSEILDVKKIDLNDDGKLEYAVQFHSLTVCDAKGNCPQAFYGFIDDDRSFMKTTAGTYDFSFRKFLFREGIINFEIGKTKTKGYKDILLRQNGNPYSNYLELYQFNGKSYQRVKCFDEDFDEDKGKAKRTLTKCWQIKN